MICEDAYEHLLATIRPLAQVVVAFSGGADSTLLLDACVQALGSDRVLAATMSTPYVPRAEIKDALRLAIKRGVRHEVIDAPFPEALHTNPRERCYLCKRELMIRLQTLASSVGFAHVVEGSNIDDLSTHRPGIRAVQDLGIISPLLIAKLDKASVRALSHWRELDTWDKPAQTCLLTRFPHDTAITLPRLQRLEAAEDVLRKLGFAGARVREHENLVRIEVSPERIPDMARNGEYVYATLKELGYAFVTVDLGGYRAYP